MASNPTYPALGVLGAEVKIMSDDQLLARAAWFSANLRRGRALIAQGQALIDLNINAYVICQNELQGRLSTRIERATDQEEARGQ